jgi:DNA-binding CsgD family transcriptional regulator
MSCLQFRSNSEAAAVTYPQVLIDKVLDLLALGVSQAEISRRTGISRATVRE